MDDGDDGSLLPPTGALRMLDYDLAAHAPSVPVLQRICRAAAAAAASSPPPDATLRSRLHKALLRAADAGDNDVLAWLLDPAGPAWPHLFADQQPQPPPPGLKPDLTACRTDDDASASASANGSASDRTTPRGTGPLVLAASSGHLEVVRTLVLLGGCDINERDHAGWTPLMWAVSASNLPLVSFLLSNGADVEIQSARGATVEDLLVTGAGTSTGALHDGALGHPTTFRQLAGSLSQQPHEALHVATDRELIADMIYEQMRIARKARAKSFAALRPLPSAVGTPSKHSSNTSYSVSRSSSPTKQLATTTPLRSPYNFSPEGSPAQARSPSSGARDAFAPDEPTTPPPPAALAHIRASSAGHYLSGASSPVPSNTSTPGSLSKRKLLGRTEREQLAEAELRARELVEGRKRALLDMAAILEIDYSTLLGEGVSLERNGAPNSVASSSLSRASMLSPLPARERGRKLRPNTDGLPSGCGALEVGSDPMSATFSFTSIPPDQMLVFSMAELDVLLDLFITNARPYRAPWARRAMPANALYLCARWAAASGDGELMDELVLSAINRIQEAVHTHHARMNHLVFWLFNATLLLHYFQRDTTLTELDVVIDDYQPLLRDIVDEIFVFVIREAERRIDKVLDAAMLEHQSVPGLGDDIRFEGEWAGLNSTLRSLAGSVKSSMTSATDGVVSSTANSSTTASPSGPGDGKGRRPLSQIFGRWDQQGGMAMTGSGSTPASAVPAHFQVGSPGSSSILGTSPGKSNASPLRHSVDPSAIKDSVSSNVASSRAGQALSVQEAMAKPSPRTITMLLSATLHMMQLYEINPAVIIQAFSQIVYWVGCELFNRLLGFGSPSAASSSSRNKRYLCRSRAMHIRLNISALEDWARSNALPLSIINAHITPLRELVSWLQCQSSLREFDALIVTMQSLRALNPAQMRKAVKEYRYEVGEGRMSEECLQYLEQLQKDWERRSKDLEEAAQIAEERRVARARLEQQQSQRDKEKSKGRQRTHSPMLRPGEVGRHSKHRRSGTATQNGGTPESRSPSPSVRSLEEDNDVSTNKSIGSATTAINEDELSPAEKIAHRAQLAIDSLFEPGRSMNDYVPPWTAAGGPPGPSGEVVAPCGPSGPAEMIIGEHLHSREMLPFALPSRPDALIVTPGDAFGFGRGHFTGTGSPALKNVRAAAGAFAPPDQGEVSSGAAGAGAEGDGGLHQEAGTADGASVTSGTSSSALTSASSRSNCSSLYPTGKGFAAGGSWEPVPILPDGFLEQVDRYLARALGSSPAAGTSALPSSHQQHVVRQRSLQAGLVEAAYQEQSGRTPTEAEAQASAWLPEAEEGGGHDASAARAKDALELGARTDLGGSQEGQGQGEEQHQSQHHRPTSGLSALPARHPLSIPGRPDHGLGRIQTAHGSEAVRAAAGGSRDELDTPVGRPAVLRSPSGRQLL